MEAATATTKQCLIHICMFCGAGERWCIDSFTSLFSYNIYICMGVLGVGCNMSIRPFVRSFKLKVDFIHIFRFIVGSRCCCCR